MRLVIVLGSLPPVRPLFVRVFQLISAQTTRNRKSSHSYLKQHDPNSIPMQRLANKRTPKETDSERHILPEGGDILRTTHVQVISKPKESKDDSNENFNAVKRGLAF